MLAKNTSISKVLFSHLRRFGQEHFAGEALTLPLTKWFFNHFGNTLVAYLLVALYTFLWTLLLIIPGIIAAYSYSMTFYILADNPDLKGDDARKMSMEMMNGHKMDLFLLHLSYIGWIILCILTFGILYFWVLPWIINATAIFYDNLKAAPPIQAAPAQVVE